MFLFRGALCCPKIPDMQKAVLEFYGIAKNSHV